MSGDQRPAWAVRLETERRARGWSKQEMARRLLAVDGLSQGTARNLARQVLRWENGEVFPRDWADAYAAVFELDRTELFREFPQSGEGRGVELVGTVVGRARPGDGDEDVRRRALLELLTALGVGAAVPLGTVDTALAALEDSLGGPGEEMDVAGWQNTAWEYSQMIWVHPVGVLTNSLASDIATLAVTLQRETRPEARRELLRVSAELTTYMAQELGDMGRFRDVRRAMLAATRAADESGDQELATWVRCYHANSAFWEGRPAHVVAGLIDDALAHAPKTANAGLAKAFKTQAHLLAAQGDASGAESALRRMYEVYERLPGEITQDHISPHGFSENSLRQADAYVYAVLGDANRAAAAAEQSLELLPLERKGSRVNVHLMHSIALVHDHDVTEGLNLALNAHEGMPTSRSRRRITAEIIKALPNEKARTLSAARELRTLASAKT
ncbi:helix-turn-helix domain-containing protein [Thermomonospora amylolytica]|uniref:helix-turn-helix domain-containing protein n=1 Tax=Thermomonospora amylolytica TaxID=1411117 RepID=UPI000E6C4987|nr:helix-turn-helix transcriptional regulator [Thermomonospora amylolytica]